MDGPEETVLPRAHRTAGSSGNRFLRVAANVARACRAGSMSVGGDTLVRMVVVAENR